MHSLWRAAVADDWDYEPPQHKVTRTERGWIGHFCCADRCLFRRNTLLRCGHVSIVVSSVGLLENHDKAADAPRFRQISGGHHFETMAFHSDPSDVRWADADVGRQVTFESPCKICEVDADDKANDMHEAVVSEITRRLAAGENFTTGEESEC